jgi:ABC-2 type transport system ATP-binding protein
MKPCLEIKNISASYGKFEALKDINITLNAGTITGLIGPNGAGKTSLVNAICGQITPRSGEIIIQGERLTAHSTRSHRIGLVPQDIALYPFLTARENLEAFAQYLSLPKAKQSDAINSALSDVELSDKADMRISHMSGGMKRRINVAAAIMHSPALLILDEPTAGVDTPARDAIHSLLKKLAASGMTIILVTHELDEVEHYCDHVLFLAAGRVLAHAECSKILSRAFGERREVIIDFARPPNETHRQIMQSFALKPGSVPTRWQLFTPINNETYLTKLVTTAESLHPAIRDVSIRRPNLTRLMEIVEKTGAFPR